MWAESGAEAFRHLAVSGRSQARKALGARTGITFYPIWGVGVTVRVSAPIITLGGAH